MFACSYMIAFEISVPVLFSSYRTLIRPSFKITYKQVTALEWRCCPGFVGEECREGEFLVCAFFPFLSHVVGENVVSQGLK